MYFYMLRMIIFIHKKFHKKCYALKVNTLIYSKFFYTLYRYVSLMTLRYNLDVFIMQLQPEFIKEVQILLKVLFMFVPTPIFWALSDQQGSRWTLQAEKLNGDLVQNYFLKSLNRVLVPELPLNY